VYLMLLIVRVFILGSVQNYVVEIIIICLSHYLYSL
jgi:hypothetical protein